MIEGTSDSSAIDVKWTVHNDAALCSRLERVNITLITMETAVNGSSLTSKLGSVTLPMASTSVYILFTINGIVQGLIQGGKGG